MSIASPSRARRRTIRTPKLRHHKATGQAFVELNGHRHYLGAYGSDKARQRYHRLLAEWTAHGGRLPVAQEEITVTELCERYIEFATGYYGEHSHELYPIREVLRQLDRLYGDTVCVDFGPVRLRTVRQQWVDRGLSRYMCNKHTERVRRVFKWAVSEELVPGETLYRLQAVTGLKYGRTPAPEREPVRPVPQEHIDKVVEALPAPLAGLVRIQVLTGARPGEVVGLRATDIDRSGRIWTAEIKHHKNSHHGHTRTLYFGEQAQAVLREFMARRPLGAPLFSPRDTLSEIAAGCECHRRPNQRPNPRKTDRVVNDQYTTDSYRRAIERACKRAGVPTWTPHRLRHTAATRIRKDMGLDAAQVWLGHRNADITQTYAEVDKARAFEIAERVG